jgi:GlpG protein
MRQVGALPDETQADRFAAWLVAQRIQAHAEPDGGGWAIWVRDEDRLSEAREALAHFQANPNDPRYQNARKAAEDFRRQEEQERERARKNVVEMRGRWGGGPTGVSRRCPLVIALIGASVLAFIVTDMGQGQNSIIRWMLFADPIAAKAGSTEIDNFSSIRRGEVWRLITPAFIHFGVLHLVMNMYWMWQFGGQIEDRRGQRFFALLWLALAVLSSVGQAVEAQSLGYFNFSGGMSGVVYGLFGYLLVKVKFDNRWNYRLDPVTTFLVILWFVLCIVRDYPPFDGWLGGTIDRVANSAHAVGLFAGLAIAYAPLLVKRAA